MKVFIFNREKFIKERLDVHKEYSEKINKLTDEEKERMIKRTTWINLKAYFKWASKPSEEFEKELRGVKWAKELDGVAIDNWVNPFGNHLEYYNIQELETIIARSARCLGVEIDEQGTHEMARRSRGTPRLANRLLKRVRDFAQVKYNGKITGEVANYALNLLDVDKDGLDRNDRLILSTIINKYNGGPVGIETLAASIGEDSGTLEDVYEPYLIQNGFINRTPRGRVATDLAYKNLGIEHL